MLQVGVSHKAMPVLAVTWYVFAMLEEIVTDEPTFDPINDVPVGVTDHVAGTALLYWSETESMVDCPAQKVVFPDILPEGFTVTVVVADPPQFCELS